MPAQLLATLSAALCKLVLLMLEVITYFICSYLVLSVLCIIVSLKLRLKGKAALISWMVVLVLPFTPYLVIVIQTRALQAQLTKPIQAVLAEKGQSSTILEVEVMQYTGATATVYVVGYCQCHGFSGCGSGAKDGGMMQFRLTKHGWTYDAASDKDVPIWSECSNGDDNTFPPMLSGG
jgi:hypothetical protein